MTFKSILLAAIAAFLTFGASASEASAQEAETESVAVEDEATAKPSTLDETPADRAYHDAFLRLARGERSGAVARLRELVTNHPDHPLAPRARRVLNILDPEWQDESAVAKGPRFETNGEETSGTARAELAIVQTLHGVALGAEFCVMLECDDVRAVTASLVLGGGAGLGLSLGLTRDGITPGHAAALNTGTGWGAWQGIALIGIEVVDDSRPAAALLAGTQLAGLGLGELSYRFFQPRAGDVSLATTVGLWTGALGLFAHGIGDFEASDDAVWWTLLIASDAGFVAGGLLTSVEPMSRSRALIINSAGIVGTLLGFGLPAMIQGDEVEGRTLFVGATIGSLLGLGGGYMLTTKWDDDLSFFQGDVTPTIALSPEGEPRFGLVGTF